MLKHILWNGLFQKLCPTKLANLNAEKERLLAKYKTARTEAQEYESVKQNVDALLTVPKRPAVNLNYDLVNIPDGFTSAVR